YSLMLSLHMSHLSLCSPSSSTSVFIFLMLRRPSTSTLFPYTTLFRSQVFAGSADLQPQLSRSPHLQPRRPLHPEGADAVELSHRSEEHTSELQSRENLVCRLLLEKKKYNHTSQTTNTKKSYTEHNKTY